MQDNFLPDASSKTSFVGISGALTILISVGETHMYSTPLRHAELFLNGLISEGTLERKQARWISKSMRRTAFGFTLL